jgi:hypothetical protein
VSAGVFATNTRPALNAIGDACGLMNAGCPTAPGSRGVPEVGLVCSAARPAARQPAQMSRIRDRVVMILRDVE